MGDCQRGRHALDFDSRSSQARSDRHNIVRNRRIPDDLEFGAGSSQVMMMVFVTIMGVGMGLSIPSFLVAVQTSVERRNLGTATSTLQFSRSMGGTLGVSVMGAALSMRLASNF